MKRLAIAALIVVVALTSVPAAGHAAEFTRQEQVSLEKNRHGRPGGRPRPNHRPKHRKDRNKGAKIGAAVGIGALVGTVIGMGIASTNRPKQEVHYYQAPQPQYHYQCQPTLVYDPVRGVYYYQ